jgi:hypothetical protein
MDLGSENGRYRPLLQNGSWSQAARQANEGPLQGRGVAQPLFLSALPLGGQDLSDGGQAQGGKVAARLLADARLALHRCRNACRYSVLGSRSTRSITPSSFLMRTRSPGWGSG